MRLISPRPASAFYPANAAQFDGSTTYLAHSDFGITSNSRGILSFWYKPTGGTQSSLMFFTNKGTLQGSVGCQLDASGALRVFLTDNGNTSTTVFLAFKSNNSIFTVDNIYKHILISWDTNFSAGNKLYNLYVNGLNVATSITDASAAFNVDLQQVAWWTGANHDTNQKITGALSELYFSVGTYMDFSILANRRKFITSSNRPAILGSNGSLPTGSQPLIYFKGSGTGFNVNSGTGGDFTTLGTLTTPTTTPST